MVRLQESSCSGAVRWWGGWRRTRRRSGRRCSNQLEAPATSPTPAVNTVRRTSRPPTGSLRRQATRNQMLTASLRPAAVRTKLRRINIQLLGQAAHCHRRCGGNPIRNESEPRQTAQDHRKAQAHTRPATVRRYERQIRWVEGEIPEQLLPADLRKLRKTLHLLIRKRPRCHEPWHPDQRHRLPNRAPTPPPCVRNRRITLYQAASRTSLDFGDYYRNP